MKIFCWVTLIVCSFGVLFGMFLFAATGNPFALVDAVWSGILAFWAVVVGDLKLVDYSEKPWHYK